MSLKQEAAYEALALASGEYGMAEKEAEVMYAEQKQKRARNKRKLKRL